MSEVVWNKYSKEELGYKILETMKEIEMEK